MDEDPFRSWQEAETVAAAGHRESETAGIRFTTETRRARTTATENNKALVVFSVLSVLPR